ncbi:MAG: YqhA family protein [Anaerolineales bacterium]|nr:YqhA family protein [Anaerolineales bacterium]
MKQVEQLFEGALWHSRLVVIVAVVASVLVGFGVFYMTTVDTVIMLSHLVQYADPGLATEARATMRLSLVAEVVAIVDGYLLAAIMLILALGLYELFVNKIDEAEGSEFANRLLLIRSFDDLKDRLARVVLLILIVKFFQQALRLKYADTVDLLFLAIGIVLIGAAIFLSHRRDDH